MEKGSLGKFRNLREPLSCERFSNQMFFVSNIDLASGGVEITLFNTGETWVFDLIELQYYADIL